MLISLRWQSWLIALAVVMFHFGSTAAAEASGAIEGVIVDDSGAVLAGVTVVATSPAVQGSRTAITGASGRYRITSLPPGVYEVVFYYGSAVIKRQGIQVRPGATSKVSAKIEDPGGELIVIESAPPVIDQTSTVTGVTLGGRNLPPPRAAPKVDLALEFGAQRSREHYQDHGVNPMTDTAVDRHSTFSIDVDTASYSIARNKIREGVRPPPESVRVEEWVNYFKYGYGGPAGDSAFAVHMDAAPSPFRGGHTLLRVGVQAKKIAAAERKPANLVFLVDVSGSMGVPDKLPLAKRALRLLVRQLEPRDTVSLVTYAGRTEVVLEPTSARYQNKIVSAIAELGAGGSTAMGAGIDLAYRQAMKGFIRGGTNRVIVLSDGDANVGATSHQAMLESIAGYVERGVTLTTVGFGTGNYQDHKMEQLADNGNGSNHYVDSLSEARNLFGAGLSGTLEVVAKDVKIQVEFNPRAVRSYRLLGYENRAIADEDFRDDKVDAGEIGAGHSVTAMYEVLLADGERTAPLAVVRLRAKKPDGTRASEIAYRFDRSQLRRRFRDAHVDFRFAAAVVAASEIVRESEWAESFRMADVIRIARVASTPGQLDRQEFIELMSKMSGLQYYSEPGAAFYSSPRARRGTIVAGAGIGSVTVSDAGQSRTAPITSFRLGYGRGATDLALEIGRAEQFSGSMSAHSSADPARSMLSLGAVLSHRLLPDALIHPVAGVGVETVRFTSMDGDTDSSLAALVRAGFELAATTRFGAVAVGFDAGAHVPLARPSERPSGKPMLTLGTYLQLRL